jgi:transcriptional regulator with XRE-family HTH domain
MPQRVEKTIGRVLAARRKRLGLSQEALAEAAGLHSTYISLLERGLRCPSATVLLKLADGLQTKASSLMASVERELAAPAKPPAAAKARVPRRGGTR